MKTIGTIRPVRPASVAILLCFLALFVSGCSTGVGNQNAGLSLVDAQGNHPAAFRSIHPAFAVSNIEQCKPCHGGDLRGGIANTSCFTAACHHGTIPSWASPGSHGAEAKKAPGNSGFASCRICHASDFAGGGSQVSCLNNGACHGSGIQSPHPPRPWRASSGLTHTTTDPANAPVCATCHFPGSANNPPNHPASPAPSGTAPGCYNNTLCHGPSAAPHALGAAWRDPSVGGANFHGLTAKQDLAYCQSCHGTPGSILFNGGIAPTSCSSAGCHASARAHPVPWYQAPQSFPNYIASHRTSGNRAVACALCHDVTQGRTAPDPASPSCFSSAFQGNNCHPGGPGSANHPVPYLDPDHLGVTQSRFDNVVTGCANCHAVSGTSPVSGAPACRVCHTAGSPLSATSNFGVCTSCHGGNANDPLTTGPDGTVYPNVAGAHAKHRALNSAGTPVFCDTCHDGLGFVTQAHYDRANARPGLDALRVEPGDVAFIAPFPYTTGTATFDNTLTALSCGSVSCHGGQTTPGWRTVLGTGNAACTPCHKRAGTAVNGAPANYYNDYTETWVTHNNHLSRVANIGGSCSTCHTTLPANIHFGTLADKAIASRAAAFTINNAFGYATSPPPPTRREDNCDTGALGGCH